MDLKWILVLAVFLAFIPEIYAGCCQYSNGCDDADNIRACGTDVQDFISNGFCCTSGRCSVNGVCPSSGSAPRTPTTTTPSSGSTPIPITQTQPRTATTISCPKIVSCGNVQVDLCSNRENCGQCGNECEGPIDGGYCCSQGKCTDNSTDSAVSICGYSPPSTQPSPSSNKKTYNFKIQVLCDNDKVPSGYFSPFYKMSTDLTVNFVRNARFDMSKQNTYQLNVTLNDDLIFGINTSTARVNFISLSPYGNPPENVSYVETIEGIQVGHVVVSKVAPNNSVFEIKFKAPDMNCDETVRVTGTAIRQTTTSPGMTAQTTTTARISTPATTTTFPPNMIPFKIFLKGDYDQAIEYSTIYLNGRKIGDACTTCSKTCEELQQGLIQQIDINQYCFDGFIDVKFVDTPTVDDFCNSVHKACIEIDGNEYCCEKQCDMYGCENHVSFECDRFTCVELSDLIIKDFYCKDKSCGFRIKRNILEKNTSYVISAFNETNGKIYYSFTGSFGPKSTGQIFRPLNVYATCQKDTELPVILTVFDSNNNLLYVEKLNRGFKC
ncbi:MAG: hypothetical protein QXF12_03895 [Candidatus Aenigmatarchaeota archaeon]